MSSRESLPDPRENSMERIVGWKEAQSLAQDREEICTSQRAVRQTLRRVLS